MSVNKVLIIGRLGKDPEIKSTFCTFSIATSEKWKDKQSGEMKEQTEWHNCIAFGKTAELVGAYVRKGSLVYIEGKLSTTKKDDKYFTNIQVQSIQFLDSKKDGQAQESRPQKNDEWGGQPYGASNSNTNITADEIPF